MTKLVKIQTLEGRVAAGFLEENAVRLFALDGESPKSLGELFAADDPAAALAAARKAAWETLPLSSVKMLAPIDDQEVWAAGVTYQRSKVAREEESVGAAQFYDKVYTADRPELFLKATPRRVVHPFDPVRVRADGKWNVPEPEWTLIMSPAGHVVAVTIGNDMSSRDIEGENPLYLPQAKIYEGSCAVGPCVVMFDEFPDRKTVTIKLTIERGGSAVFEGTTGLDRLTRTPESLASWLFRENSFPDGAMLMTGTGIIPPDDFSLQSGDVVHIDIEPIGRLTNPVA